MTPPLQWHHVAQGIVSEVCRPTRKMVSSDRFLSAVAIEPRTAFAGSQCNRILENPREKRTKGRDGPTRHSAGWLWQCGLNAIPANAACRLADRWGPPDKMGQPTVASFDMTTLLCAIGAIIILVYSAFVIAYVRRAPASHLAPRREQGSPRSEA